MLFCGVLLFFIQSGCAQMFDGESCLSCIGVTKPQDCQNVVKCPSGEICSTERYITHQGHIAYDLLCKHNDTCHKSGFVVSSAELEKRRNQQSSVSKRRFSQLVHACEECCDSPNCNELLCGGVQGGGVECHSCEDLADMNECQNIEHCHSDEVCFVNQYITDQYMVRFEGGCIHKHYCEIFKNQRQKTDSAPCFSCCDGNLCNDECRQDFNMTSTPKPTHHVTSTPKPTHHVTLTPKPTHHVTATPKPTHHVTATPKPTHHITATPKPTHHVTATPKPTHHVTATPKPTHHVTATPKPTHHITATPKPTHHVTATPKPTHHVTSTPKPTHHVTATPKPTHHITATPKPTHHVTATPKPTHHVTATPKPTHHITATPKPTHHVTSTPKPTHHVTATPKPTHHVTATPKPTHHVTATPKPTHQHISTTPKVHTTTIAPPTTTDCPRLPTSGFSPTTIVESSPISKIGCGEKSDITFLLDTSQYINDFEEHELDYFVQGLVSSFDISPETSRIGLVHFNQDAKLGMSLDKGYNLARVISYLKYQEKQNGLNQNGVDLGLGIQKAHEMITSKGRQHVKQYLIILTTDNITDIHHAIREANKARQDDGVEVFVFGMGAFKDNLFDLQRLVTHAQLKDNIVIVEHVEDLGEELEDILIGHCKGKSDPKPPCWDQSKLDLTNCDELQNVHFVVDQSTHTNQEQLGKVEPFIKEFLNNFTLHPGAHVSLTVYSNEANVTIKQHNKIHGFLYDVHSVLHNLNTSGPAYTHVPLKKFSNILHVDETNVVVLFTNGGSERLLQTISAAMDLHRTHAHVFVVQLGETFHEKEQMVLASNPDSQYILSLGDADTLNAFLDYLASQKCKRECSSQHFLPKIPIPQKASIKSWSKLGCGGHNDVMFLVDGSAFLNDMEEREMINFVKSLASTLDLGQHKTRVGYTYFNSDVHQVIPLEKGTNIGLVNYELNKLLQTTLTTGIANLSLALGEVETYMKHNSNAQHKFIVILIQDNITDVDGAVKQAQRAQRLGYEFFFIGIGRFYDYLKQLNQIVSHPPEEHLRLKDFVSDLGTVLETLVLSRCQDITTNTVDSCIDPKLLNSLGCGRKEDISLIVDVSNNTQDLQKVKEFIDEYVKSLTISPNATSIGLMTFDYKVNELLQLHNGLDKNSLVDAIHNNLSKIHKTTAPAFTNYALDKALEWYKTSSPGTDKIAIIFTNGHTPRTFEMVASAMELHRQHVTVFVVGTGQSPDVQQQRIMASDPDGQHIFQVSDGSTLRKYLLTHTRCKNTS